MYLFVPTYLPVWCCVVFVSWVVGAVLCVVWLLVAYVGDVSLRQCECDWGFVYTAMTFGCSGGLLGIILRLVIIVIGWLVGVWRSNEIRMVMMYRRIFHDDMFKHLDVFQTFGIEYFTKDRRSITFIVSKQASKLLLERISRDLYIRV